jgi:hypothetical protein
MHVGCVSYLAVLALIGLLLFDCVFHCAAVRGLKPRRCLSQAARYCDVRRSLLKGMKGVGVGED